MTTFWKKPIGLSVFYEGFKTCTSVLSKNKQSYISLLLVLDILLTGLATLPNMGLQRFENLQWSAAKFILRDYIFNCKSRLIELLSLMYWFELNDIMF